MSKLDTKYMGLPVKSPIIVGSCGLSNNVENIEKMEAAGAGAVVMKSIFEEQIIFDIKKNANQIAPVDNYGDSYEYIAAHVASDNMSRFFSLVTEAKKRVQLPIIGSINCYSFENWLNYAKRFQEAGCDGLELNMAILPYETTMSADDVERLFTNVINALKKAITIPIAIKVSHNFTDLAKFMQQLSWTGIKSLTLFNKPLNIDIDVENLTITHADSLSVPQELYSPMRWIAILANKVRCEISASTGVAVPTDVVKLLLAGAQTVQVVSSLYRNGVDYVKTLNDGLRAWMEAHDFETLEQFRGRLAMKPGEEASVLLRTQFMKYVAHIGD